MGRYALVLVLAAAVVAQAQSTSATRKKSGGAKPPAKTEQAPPVWRIETLKVEGNRNYTPQQILQVAKLKVGQPATKADFDAARDRLISAGAFENIGYRYTPSAAQTGYDVVLEVQEAQPGYPYKFEDLPADPKELETALAETDLLFGPRIPATDTLLKRYAAALQQYLAAKGFSGKVVAKVSQENISDLMIVFRPDSSPENVAEVRFTGASVIPAADLQRAIHDVAIGSVYQDSRFRQYLDLAIRPLYDNRGRLRVAFPKLTTEKAKDVKGLVVTVAVQEGESYTLGDVKVEGAPAGRAKFKTGDVANMMAVQESVDVIQQQVRRQGYLKVTSQVDRKLDDAKHIVNLTVRVTPGPQYTFGQLQIQGLDIIGEAAIKKMWSLEPGKPFDAAYPDVFLNRVREEGLFDSLGETKSVVKVDDQNKTADVTLLFKGAPMPERKGRRRENW
jgi:outer membrane protein insertion porin family